MTSGNFTFTNERTYGTKQSCFGLLVDMRYILPRPDSGCHAEEQARIAVSYGLNPYYESTTEGFLLPPYKPGEFLFGLHSVGVHKQRLTVYDAFWDSIAAPTTKLTPKEAQRHCQKILGEITDAKYGRFASDNAFDSERIYHSSDHRLEEFVICPSSSYCDAKTLWAFIRDVTSGGQTQVGKVGHSKDIVNVTLLQNKVRIAVEDALTLYSSEYDPLKLVLEKGCRCVSKELSVDESHRLRDALGFFSSENKVDREGRTGRFGFDRTFSVPRDDSQRTSLDLRKE